MVLFPTAEYVGLGRELEVRVTTHIITTKAYKNFVFYPYDLGSTHLKILISNKGRTVYPFLSIINDTRIIIYITINFTSSDTMFELNRIHSLYF